MLRSCTLAALLLFWFCFSPARAQTPTCNNLAGAQKTVASELLSSLHPYACCDGTIAECLAERPVCALAFRLAEDICRRIADKQDKAAITRGISRRARSMLPAGKQAAIDLSGLPMLGAQDAPVTLVEYACARCPFCAKITPKLYRAVKDGPLAGKLKCYFKLFPIRDHKYSKETGMGFMAAAELGKFWELMLLSYERFDRFCIDKQAAWAKEAGMDPDAFQRLAADTRLRGKLVASKKEGLVNKVQATPTFFINGRKYTGDLTIEELIDVLEEEYERVTNVEYRK
ncbi:MAG TPA: thioredoxin domain-containing protein [Myxococcota bacterium]|nr:thioredoxin domain-containing protein [Myxococcota bacterium]